MNKLKSMPVFDLDEMQIGSLQILEGKLRKFETTQKKHHWELVQQRDQMNGRIQASNEELNAINQDIIAVLEKMNELEKPSA